MLKYWHTLTVALIEPLTIPLLTKSSDFLFDEGKKFLEDKRKPKESKVLYDD
jgi:hypothetical protein